MRKNITALCLFTTMIFSFTSCSDNGGGLLNSNFSAKDAIKIEDIDWSVTEGVMDGERFISFNYTNNSKYTILDLEIEFKQKEDISSEQLSVFDDLKKEREWTDEDIKL